MCECWYVYGAAMLLMKNYKLFPNRLMFFTEFRNFILNKCVFGVQLLSYFRSARCDSLYAVKS